MAQKFLTAIDLSKNELQNVALQNLASNPSNPKKGQIYFNSSNNNVCVYNGTKWISEADFIKTSAIVDALTSTDADKVLSANQGKILKGLIDSVTGYFNGSVAKEAAKVSNALTIKLNGQDDLTYNGSAAKTLTLSAANIVTAIGNNAVARASADSDGNTINTTYTKLNYAGDWSGIINFTSGIKINGVTITRNSNGVLYIDGDLAVSGDITSFADADVDVSTIRDAIGNATNTYKGLAAFSSNDFTVTDGVVYLKAGAGSGGGDVSTEDVLTIVEGAGYAKQSYVSQNYISKGKMGVANGVATLDDSGLVPSSQLPSYVDDVVEGYLYNGKFYKESSHTNVITAESGKIYVDISTSKSYRWGGSTYTEIAAATIHKYVSTLTGTGSTKDFTITHSLGTRDVVVSLYENGSNYQQVWADVKMTSTSAVTVSFAEAPATGTNYRIVIIA